MGAGQIGTGDDDLTLINETAGVIDATGLLIVETGSNRIKNAGLFEATGGGALEIESRLHNSGEVLALAGSEVLFEANVHNGSDGRIVARGNEAQVEFADGHLRNDGSIVAEHNGRVLFDEGVIVTNKFDGVIKATHHGAVEFDDAIVVNKDGGEIVSIGCGSQVDFQGGSIGNDGLIVAKYDGMVLFDEGATVTNKSDGLIRATDGGTVKFDNAEVFNHHGGLIEAVGDGSTVDFCYSCVDNAGKIVSVGCNSEVDFRGGFLGNSGAVVADYDGTVLFDNATVINKHDGRIEATDGGTVKFDNTDVSNDQDAIIKAAGDGSTVDFCYSCVDNAGKIVSIGCNSEVDFRGGFLGNSGAVVADYDGTVKFDNTGVSNDQDAIIKAAGDGSTVDFCYSCVDNSGTIKAWQDGTIYFDHTDVDNTCGVIAAIGCGSIVDLDHAFIVGGELETGWGGLIQTVWGNSTFEDLTITCGSEVLITDGTSLTLQGTIHNFGTIDVDEEHSGADLVIDGTVSLDGSGEVLLDGYHDDIVAGSHGGTLDNDSTILGAGAIGNGDCSLTLNNQKDGVVDATGRIVVDTGRNAIRNTGLLEATCFGTLEIKSDVDNKGGTIAAYGLAALVELFGVTITGGTLATGDPYWRDDGIIEVLAAGGVSIFDGSEKRVTVAGFVQVDSAAKLELRGDIHFDGGAIELDQASYGFSEFGHNSDLHAIGSDLVIDGAVTLDGNGDIALEGLSTKIVGACEGSTLFNDISIIGSRGGYIGDGGSLTLDNEKGGVVDSEAGAAGPLIIDTGCNVIINAGLIEATGASELDIKSDVNNIGGIIGAYEDGSGPSVVKLFGVVITGGTLATDNGSMIEVVAGRDATTFDGSNGHTVTIDGYVRVDEGATLDLIGTIHNQGLIDVDSQTVLGADLIIDGQVTLNGHGAVTLDNSHDKITGIGESTLTNVNNTISGAGEIGGGDHEDNYYWNAGFDEDHRSGLTLNNEANGTIDANLNHQTLTIDTGNTVDNDGLMEATNGGRLLVRDDVDNHGGWIVADTGATAYFTGDVNGGSAKIFDATLEFGAQSSADVTFNNSDGYGKLVLDSLHFSGNIYDFAGDGLNSSDEIDLTGINKNFVQFTHDAQNNAEITIKFGAFTLETITLVGFNYENLEKISDGHGGTTIYDPPSGDASASIDTSASVTADGAISVASAEPENALSASFTAEGAGYAGNFSLTPVGTVDGNAVVGWEFDLGNDQINLAPGQTATQSYNVSVNEGSNTLLNQTVSVSLGGAGNDNFVFAPGMGADTIANFDPQHDTIELDHFANVQSVQQLASMITTDIHGDAVIDLGNHDSITIPGMNATQLQQVLQSVVHLH